MSDSFAIPWTVAHQAPLSMKFPRQVYWTGLPFPPPGDLPVPVIESVSPALQADSSPLSHWGSPAWSICTININMMPYIVEKLSPLQPGRVCSNLGFRIIFWIISKIIIKMELCVHYISCFSSTFSFERYRFTYRCKK